MKKNYSLTQVILFALLAASVAMVITYYMAQSAIASRLTTLTEAQKTFDVLTEVKRCVEKNYVGEFDPKTLSSGAVEGYIASLGDEWSYYLSPEEYTSRSSQVIGAKAGVGIRVSRNAETGEMVIEEVYEGTSAAKAGVPSGAIIVSVDGADVANIGYESAYERLSGDVGSQMSLSLKNPNELLEYNLTRTTVNPDTVVSQLLGTDVGYIRIKEFSDGSNTAFSSQVESLAIKGAKKYILDVRNTGGGNLDEFLKVLDRILPKCVSFITEDKLGNRQEYNSDASCINTPMMVLVNSSSYSSAEYFAAILQEYGKAEVVGEQTTGKGYGQSTVSLSDGSAIVLSTVKYFTPKMRNLTHIGCVPNTVITLNDPTVLNRNTPDMDRDNQLAEAYRLLNN